MLCLFWDCFGFVLWFLVDLGVYLFGFLLVFLLCFWFFVSLFVFVLFFFVLFLILPEASVLLQGKDSLI